MTHELLKSLKDAGFPQKHDYFDNDIVSACIKCGDKEEDKNVIPCVPTLSELIEACGDMFFSIFCRNGSAPSKEWVAETFEDRPQGWLQADGSTPEESVARLWLQLREIKKKR